MLFFGQYRNILLSVKMNLVIYEVMIYVIPVVFAMVTYMPLAMFSQVPSLMKEMGLTPSALPAMGGVANLGPIQTMLQGVDPFMLTLNNLMMFEIAFVLGLLGGKIVAGTLWNTRALAIAMFILAIALHSMPSIMSKLLEGMAAP
jgi:hypothetical protein